MASRPDDERDQAGESPPGLTIPSHRREQESKKIRNARRTFVRRGIDESYEYLSRGRLPELAGLLAALVERIGLKPGDIEQFSGQIPAGHSFYSAELRRFVRLVNAETDPTAAVRAVTSKSPSTSTPLAGGEALLESIVSVAAVENLLPSQLQDTQPVEGYQMQLGERYVRADSRATGTLTLRDPDDQLKSILCAGGKGSGKTAAVESLALDSHANGHTVVDLVDFFKGENVTYDLRQQDNGEGLLDTRRDMDLPVGFDDVEAGLAWLDGEPDPAAMPSPEIEILIPLSPGLEQMRVPAVADEHAVVRPFTIPASELTYRQLVMLLHHTTEARENELRSAHQSLRDTGKDWTLSDVAAAVKRSSNASEKLADAIETSLRTAQEKSFIGDTECPYALDWERIMGDQSTVTAFTVHPMQETADHLVVLSYLIDSLFETRKELLSRQRLSSYPPLTVVMREMHKVAPRSTAEQSAESTTERYMIDSLEDVFALTRHANMEVIGDTQKFYRQLAPEVSGLFDHILAFQGHVPDIKHIFKTRVDDTGPAEYVAQYKEPGKCAFISEQGYRLPIQMAPPRSHHLEAKSEGSGLGFRTRVDGSPEELIESPWDAEVPERLQFDDLPDHPIERFLEQYVHVVDDRSEYVLLKDLHKAYCEWADEEDEEKFERKRVSARVSTYFEPIGRDTKYQPRVNGTQERAHRRLVLSW
jgi:hypothetical protein